LNNALYVGRLEWNRTAYVKNPRTGKKVARINAQGALEIVEVPKLRIIDDEFWHQVKARQKEARIEIGKNESGNALNRVHRRRFLLSELLVCRQRAGRYTVVGKDRYGCATRRAFLLASPPSVFREGTFPGEDLASPARSVCPKFRASKYGSLKAYQGVGMIEIPSGVGYAVIFDFWAKEKSQFANDESRQSSTGHVTDPSGMIEATTVLMEKMTITR